MNVILDQLLQDLDISSKSVTEIGAGYICFDSNETAAYFAQRMRQTQRGNMVILDHCIAEEIY